MKDNSHRFELQNIAYQLSILQEGRQIHIDLRDKATGFSVADGPYLYQAAQDQNEGKMVIRGLSRLQYGSLRMQLL